MGAPLFGYTPRRLTPDEVFDDCVKDYATSNTRPFIWDGIRQIIQLTAACQTVAGDLHVDSEFVEAMHDPERAVLAFEASESITRELHQLWTRTNGKEMLVETFLLPPRPTDPEAAQDWDATKEELVLQLTDHGRKGYPIVDFLACHSYTKS